MNEIALAVSTAYRRRRTSPNMPEHVDVWALALRSGLALRARWTSRTSNVQHVVEIVLSPTRAEKLARLTRGGAVPDYVPHTIILEIEQAIENADAMICIADVMLS